MADSKMCLGHEERARRKNIIAKLITNQIAAPDENCRVLIKPNPEYSLKKIFIFLKENICFEIRPALYDAQVSEEVEDVGEDRLQKKR